MLPQQSELLLLSYFCFIILYASAVSFESHNFSLITSRYDGITTHAPTAVWRRHDADLIRDVSNATTADWWAGEPAISASVRQPNAHKQQH